MRSVVRLLFVLPLLGILAALPARAGASDADAVYAAVGMPETVAIMRDEGLDYARDLDGDLLARRGGERWVAMVDRIYDADRLDAMLRQRMTEELAGRDLGPILEFFDSPRGRRIVGLELSARQAFLDDDVEEVGKAVFREMVAAGDPRIDKIREFVEVNELVQSNVVGALNSNYAFYTALAGGGAFDGQPGDSEILNDVWSQEPQIREETETWVYSYLTLAYQPLSDADLDAYIAFSASPDGQVLNRAMFAAFDTMFVDISRRLGAAAAQVLGGQDL